MRFKHEGIQGLIDQLGVQVIGFTEGHAYGIPIRIDMIMSIGGFYEGVRDFIGVNDTPFVMDGPLMVVLHEIVHWTGKSTRLNRRCIALTEKPNDSYLEYIETQNLIGIHGTHTEEAIAQLGALKLGMYFGLDQARLKHFTERYISMLAFADLNEAERESDRAVSYILGFIEMKKAA